MHDERAFRVELHRHCRRLECARDAASVRRAVLGIVRTLDKHRVTPDALPSDLLVMLRERLAQARDAA